MTEQVMEQVRLLDVLDLVGTPDPPGHREAPVGQVVEEIQFRQQPLDTHQRPAGGLAQDFVEFTETGDAVAAHAHRVLRGQEGLAGAAGQQRPLARVQLAPDPVVGGVVVVPGLVDNTGSVDRDPAAVGVHVLDAAGLVGGHFGHSPTVSGLRRNEVAKLRRTGVYAQ